jgi:putative OPT family oligopeptide transporter
VPLFVLYYLVVGSLGVALAMAVIMIIAGFLFSSVSGYMAGLVGSSNNPVSGITICTILFASLVLMWMVGGNSSIGAVAVVFIGAVVCNAAAVAGDNLQDLKAGQLVGATPWRQQVMLCVGVIVSAAVMAPVMNVLLFAYGIGEPSHPGVKALPAPQANLVRSVAEGMFGGTLPVGMIAIGAAVGASIIVLDLYLKRRRSRWSAPVLAVAVGIYLPLDVSTPILAGGIVAEMVARWHHKHSVGGDLEKLAQNGMLFAAGLITGEALVGIFIAMCIWISKNPDVLARASELRGGKWWAAMLLLGICYWIFRAGTPRRAAPTA